MLTVDNTLIPYFAFNSTSSFNRENVRIQLSTEDTMNLLVINNDNITHGFDIKNYTNVDTLILAGDSALVQFNFLTPSAHIYYDHSNNGNHSYMGAAGMITSNSLNDNSSKFYWNIKEHQSNFNEDINMGISVDWNTYYPNYFTINGNSNPDINQDPAARVTGSVDDTIKIYMVNTGQSLHSIHFHGYHCEIIYSSKYPNHVGRFKDTFPVEKMEVVVLQLIPDQPGEYPVHDHNLVAVSGGNLYPNGMFLTLLITP